MDTVFQQQKREGEAHQVEGHAPPSVGPLGTGHLEGNKRTHVRRSKQEGWMEVHPCVCCRHRCLRGTRCRLHHPQIGTDIAQPPTNIRQATMQHTGLPHSLTKGLQ